MTVQNGEEKRFDAQSVPRQKDALTTLVVERKRKHTAKTFYAGLTPFQPCVNDDLSIAAGAKLVSAGLEFLRQLTEVIDLPVVHQAYIAIGAEHGLLAGGQIDDRQTPVCQCHARFQKHTPFIRAAMELGLVHSL